MTYTEYKPYVIDTGYLFPLSLADFLGAEDEVHIFSHSYGLTAQDSGLCNWIAPCRVLLSAGPPYRIELGPHSRFGESKQLILERK